MKFQIYRLHQLLIEQYRCVSPPGALAAAANGFPGMEAAGEGTSVTAWFNGVVADRAGLLGELAPGVAVGTGLEAGEVAAGVVGISYFCSCSR